jgi:MFS family permease
MGRPDGCQKSQGEIMDNATRRSKVMAIVRVSSGNFLEMYDFNIFGFYAASIGATYFPGKGSGDADFVQLMYALMTFGAGFLVRPLGALVLGAYVDRHGRRAGLLLTLALMSVGTLVIALLPGYASIGMAAPLLVLISRLIQGFSAGVEVGGVSVYLSEIAPPGKRGFYVSWQSGSQQVAIIVAALIGVLMEHYLPAASIRAWGWRIPLLFGCAIVPFLFVLRRSLEETEAFASRPRHPTIAEIYSAVAQNWKIVLLGMMMVVMTTVSFFLITVYTPTFGKRVLHLTSDEALIATLCVGITNLIWLPVSGAVSDRIGRRPILIGCTAAAILTAYPVLSWLVHAPSFGHLVAAELWLSVIYGWYNGALIAYLTEVVPDQVRTACFSMAYSSATIVGGTTPAVVTALIHFTGNGAMPGAYMAMAAAVALVSVLILGRMIATGSHVMPAELDRALIGGEASP